MVAFGVAAIVAQPALAQDKSTSFRGIRIEGNTGVDRFQSQGVHNDKFGCGARIGFDGMIGDKIVVGPKGGYWRANDWTTRNIATTRRASG